jgi:hypothetical protein
MRNAVRLTLAVAAVALGVWLWGVLFPGPEKVIRSRLKEIAELVSFPANEAPLSALTEVQQLCARVSQDVEIHVDAPGFGRRTVQGRQSLREGAMAYRSALNGVNVQFPDIRVVVSPDKQSAEVWLTVTARLPTEPDLSVQEMKLGFRKLSGDWLITRAETTKPLR